MIEVAEAASAPETSSPASMVTSRSSKTPDSACSVGNSQSQGSRSSKSRTSNSSGSGSGSSGYGGHPSTLSNGNDTSSPPQSKDKDHHKKKLKAESVCPDAPAPVAATETSGVAVTSLSEALHKKSDATSLGAGIGAPASLVELTEEVTPVEVVTLTPLLPPSDGEVLEASSPTETKTPNSPSAGIHRVAFSQSLCCISNTNAGEAEAKNLLAEEESPRTSNRHPSSQLQQPSSDKKDEFTVVVSMQDGAVIYTSPSITQVLSFPWDMWVGKSFIDYVHSNDRRALIQHITSGVALLRRQTNERGGSGESQVPLFCRLRRYASLKEGFAVAERGLIYSPFSLRLSFYELPASDDDSAALPPGVLLTITATAVASAYTEPDETPAGQWKFTTRHLADGQLMHVDGEAVSLLGYLPQELVGRPVFDIYHPADMRNLQHVYEQLVNKECESPLRGQPYRLHTHNGCYVRVHTEWSSFVNPWTRRLEFVTGQHHILQGPSHPDVFAKTQDEDMFSEELLQDSKEAQQEIYQLLQEEVRRSEPSTDRRDVSRRCKDLASFMETLIGEIGKAKLQVETGTAANQLGPSFSEHSSVTLGEISPHHDYYDSKSSSETPPSYNQLNYNDNIQRFFESKPKTIPSDDSCERLMALEPTSRSIDEDGKPNAGRGDCRAARKCLSPVNDTGSGSNSGSGSGSAGLSANNGSVDAADAGGDYKPPHLTEALLCRHNEDMEKKMVQRHREQRNKSGEGKCKKQYHSQLPPDKGQVEAVLPPQVSAQAMAVASVAHGTKRSGSHSWNGEPLKASKHSHAPSPPADPPPPDKAPQQLTGASDVTPKSQMPVPNKGHGLNLWPPFSVTVTPVHASQPCTSQGFCMVGCCGGTRPATPQLLPLYYLPTPVSTAPSSGTPVKSHQAPAGDTPAGCKQHHAGGTMPYMAAGVLYQYPLAPPPPPSPSHLLALHQHQQLSAYQQGTTAKEGGTTSASASTCRLQQGRAQQRQQDLQPHQPLPCPASCATSVKVEPGSSAASVTASLFNRDASDGSQQCCRTLGEEDTEAEDSGSGSGLQGQSSSSYCYSFLRSEGDSCQDANGADTSVDATIFGAEDMFWERMDNSSSDCAAKRRPILKDPPWLENVEMTPELMFQYQVSQRELETVLKDDLEKLRAISQPMLVNEQLGQLYLDMARLGPTAAELRLDEAELSSSSSGSVNGSADADIAVDILHKSLKKRRNIEYSKLVMIFEENAPMPSPLLQPA